MKPPADATHCQYHAHIYFDSDTIKRAIGLSDQAHSLFGVTLGRVHKQPVGPHPHWSRQLKFDASVYREFIGWLDTHREGLTVLIHSDTGNDLQDHTDHAWWLGTPAELDLSLFMDA